MFCLTICEIIYLFFYSEPLATFVKPCTCMHHPAPIFSSASTLSPQTPGSLSSAVHSLLFLVRLQQNPQVVDR